jgi:HlyD family type I secretion membrane fusion protein
VLIGLIGIAAGLGGFSLWAMSTEINGAVVAAGEVAVEARRQAIQHHDGGIVAAVHVKDGQMVKAGTPILTLDGTELAAQHALTLRDLAEVLIHLDRLKAEILGASQVSYQPAVLALRSRLPGFESALAEETTLFDARRTTLRQATAQLTERIRQAKTQIEGHTRQLDSTRKEIALIREELDGQEELYRKGLALKTRILGLRRDKAQIEGQIGELEASIAETRSSIAGFVVERLHMEAEFREKAQDEFRTLQPKEAELRERLRVLDAQTSRLILRAPMTGAVLGLQAHTVGGVIPAGAEVASIVPSATPLILFADIDPRQIDRVHAGQTAKVRFPNFDARTTPEIDAFVTSISADAIAEPTTGRHYYRAELALTAGGRATLSKRELVPGMPIEAFIQTDARSPASFLLKPLMDYWAYAMREE